MFYQNETSDDKKLLHPLFFNKRDLLEKKKSNLLIGASESQLQILFSVKKSLLAEKSVVL